jgi:2',3'-cyclic-nucleotide 2'-phosphodiesterase (5'-nucleotidase family)
MKSSLLFSLLLVLSITSCTVLRKGSAPANDDGKINITYIQVNDVYEIAPLENGKSGGMARVATLKNENLKLNPNTFLVIAGDFLSPSVYNSLQFEGKRIRGKQMVEAMNAAGMDFAVFGNHEFDINEQELQDRLNESRFRWVSSNTFHKQGTTVSPFAKVTSSKREPLTDSYIQTVKDRDGTTAKIGYIGITLPFNKASYVYYTDPLKAADSIYNSLKDSCDAIVALTHQSLENDSILAARIPGLAVIMGGHEHDQRFKKVGNVYITKAHANAKSAYIITLTIDKGRHATQVKPSLKMINDSVALDSSVNVVVQKWMNIADKNYASLGFDPRKVVIQAGEPLDGREISIRTRITNLTKIVVSAMQSAAPLADVVLVNGGSIRVDDILQMPVTQYDIIRSLPFGGRIAEVEMKGRLLIKTLEAGRKNYGIGGFLHYSPDLIYNESTGKWKLKNAPIEEGKVYRVALNDFLISGGEANMDFLKKDNADIIKVHPDVTNTSDPRADIRLAIVKYLEKEARE